MLYPCWKRGNKHSVCTSWHCSTGQSLGIYGLGSQHPGSWLVTILLSFPECWCHKDVGEVEVLQQMGFRGQRERSLGNPTLLVLLLAEQLVYFAGKTKVEEGRELGGWASGRQFPDPAFPPSHCIKLFIILCENLSHPSCWWQEFLNTYNLTEQAKDT